MTPYTKHLQVLDNGKHIGYLHESCRTQYECFIVNWDDPTVHITIRTLRRMQGGIPIHWGIAECIVCGEIGPAKV